MRDKFDYLRQLVAPNTDSTQAGVWKVNAYVIRALDFEWEENGATKSARYVYTDEEIERIRSGMALFADWVEEFSDGWLRIDWSLEVVETTATEMSPLGEQFWPGPSEFMQLLPEIEVGSTDTIMTFVKTDGEAPEGVENDSIPLALLGGALGELESLTRGATYIAYNFGSSTARSEDGGAELFLHEWLHSLQWAIEDRQGYPRNLGGNPDGGRLVGEEGGDECYRRDPATEKNWGNFYKHLLRCHYTRDMLRNAASRTEKFEPIASWGDYALCANSQAINLGVDAYAVDAAGNALLTDLAGNARFEGTVDLGAYEYQTLVLPSPQDLDYRLNVSARPTATLTWNDTDAEVGYRVEVLNDGVWTTVETLAADVVSWTSEILELGATYEYRVVAEYAAGEAVSAAISIKVGDVPQASSGLTYELDLSSNPIATLTWDYVADASGYFVQVEGDNGWTTIVELDVHQTEWTTDPLDFRTNYTYRLVVVNEYGSTILNAISILVETPSWLVTTNLDVVDANDGVMSLREAIAAAQAGDVVTFAPALKGQTITLSGTELEITKAITIDASSLYDEISQTPGITIDANQKSRVFRVRAGSEETPTTFVGLTITGGYANYSNYSEGYGSGGSVYVDDEVSTVFTNVAIIGNAAALGAGGGVRAGEWASTTFTNVTIAENTASSYGGGVSVGGNENVVTFVNSTISDNTGGDGGGVYINGTTSVATFASCVVSGNAANGSIGYGGVSLLGIATFENTTISDNESTKGGGLYAYYEAAANLTNCLIVGNEAEYGGGVCANGGTATLTGCAFSDNTATYGGALYANFRMPATFTDCAISGNTANLYGGGVYVYTGRPTFTNCSISGNTTNWYGGGVYAAYGTTTLRNTIVALNTATSSGADVYDNAATFNAHNALSSFTAWDNANESGVVNYVYDATKPLFKDAANGDYTLAANSQALNKGNDAHAVDAAGNALLTDLAGNARFVG
ncbi:MAG: hypothetical protein IKU86_07555, partial [Thermoguttaceae bacterium]|nr:hypothetical protein [Thermoguttaceae bacterium]